MDGPDASGPHTTNRPRSVVDPRLFLVGAVLGVFPAVYLGFAWRVLWVTWPVVGRPPSPRAILAIPLATGLLAVALSALNVVGTDVGLYPDRIERRGTPLREGTTAVPYEDVALVVRHTESGRRFGREPLTVVRADAPDVELPHPRDTVGLARVLEERVPPPADRSTGDGTADAVASVLGDRVVVSSRELGELLGVDPRRVEGAPLDRFDPPEFDRSSEDERSGEDDRTGGNERSGEDGAAPNAVEGADGVPDP